MNILFLSPVVPNPPNNGGRLRVHHLLSALTARHRVTFAAHVRPGESAEDWDLAGRLAAPPILVPRGPGGGGRVGDGWMRRAAGLPPGTLPDYLRGADPLPFWERLAALPLEDFDVVQGEWFAMAPFVLAAGRHAPGARLVVDLVDLTSNLRLQELRSWPGRLVSRTRLRGYADLARLRAAERLVLGRLDGVLASSALERSKLPGRAVRARATAVPNGVDAEGPPPLAEAEGSSLLAFVGDMSYEPNVEGALFFHGEVLPLVRREVPGAGLCLVGRAPDPAVLRLDDPTGGVTVTGTVPDVRPYLGRSVAAVAPILSGGGTRLKILEAMAAGRPVVSTSKGAEGLDLRPGIDLLIADDARGFAECCVRLIRDPDLRRDLVEAGRRAARRYDWSVARGALGGLYAALEDSPRPVRWRAGHAAPSEATP